MKVLAADSNSRFRQGFSNELKTLPKNPVLARVIEPSRIARRAMAARGE